MIRVLIADDQRVIREGLQTLLGLLPDLEVIGAVSDGEAAVRVVAEQQPDVVLMDLRMPHLDGVRATERIAREHPRTRVLVLTTYAEDGDVLPALRAGARGYLTKDAGAEEIAAAIATVHRGEMALEPAVQAQLVGALARGAPDELTPRELEVLSLIARGLSNREIAEELVISMATVKTHINRVLMKTGSRDRAQAVRYAFEHRIT